jgi:hypothetical protein
LVEEGGGEEEDGVEAVVEAADSLTTGVGVAEAADIPTTLTRMIGTAEEAAGILTTRTRVIGLIEEAVDILTIRMRAIGTAPGEAGDFLAVATEAVGMGAAVVVAVVWIEMKTRSNMRRRWPR